MKNILQGLGIVFTLIASFLGLMYFMKGDIIVSSLVSCVIVVIEFFLIQQFIKNKTEITKNRFSFLAIVLWLIYIILAIPMTLFLVHALNVEINAKKEIQSIANKKVQDLDQMVNTYTSLTDSYLTKKRTDLKTALTLYVADPSAVHEAILKNPPYNLPVTILSTVNDENINSKANTAIGADNLLLNKIIKDSITPENTDFKDRYSNVFDNWSRLHLNYAFYELDKLLEKNYQRLQKSYTQFAPDATTKFNYAYSKDTTDMSDPVVLWKKHQPYYLIIVVLLFHTLILLPYFIEPVSGVYIKQKGPRSGGGIEL